MLELYAWGTTNGRRGLIIAEECGLPYKLHPVDIHKGDQKSDAFGKLNPHRKIPVLVDTDGPGGKPATLFESAAICFYLAEKAGKFLGTPEDHPNVLKWSMYHVATLLPLLSQFRGETAASVEEPTKKQLDIMNQHLAGRDWFAGDYSVADIIPFTRINQINHERVKVADYPNLAAWLKRVAARPAVAKAMEQKFG